MKELVIGTNDAGQRLDKFLSKAAPGLPLALLYKYIRLKRVKVNGKKADGALRLCEGDRLTLYINDSFFEKPKAADFLAAPAQADILYEDAHILVLDKKPGLVVHEDESGSPDTLINRVLHLLYNRGEYDPARENSFTPALCNRIDRNTGGIVLAAKTAPALRVLNEKIRAHEVRKRYLCIVHGQMPRRADELRAFLVKDEHEKTVRVFDRPVPYGLTAVTRYRVLETRGALSLLEIELVTGRTHQIRAQMAHIGHPLLGDGKYGDTVRDKPYHLKGQALYAYAVTFAFTGDTAPLDSLAGKTLTVPDIWFADAFHAGAFDGKQPRG